MNYVLKYKHNIVLSFSIKNINSIYFIIFFPIIFFYGKFIPSQLHLFIQGLTFFNSYGSFLISSWFNAIFTAYWKHQFSFLLMEFIVAFLFFIQSRESIHDPPRFGFIMWHLEYNKINIIQYLMEDKLNIFNWF